ncbi:hypothetical protein JCM10908_006499 [Rhodotorula pacifica]|uniref:uncharacterized protein n=1 Tax=Rhodotorula pacifica TaxID=1495444 RepID=UPI0031812A08
MYNAPHGNDSTWSLEEDGRNPFGGKETAGGGIQRGSDNPYAADYKGGQSKGAWKKWTLLGLLVLLIVGGVAGGIAGWKVSQNNKDNSASGSSSSSSSGGSGKMQYIDGTAKAVKWNPSDPSQFQKDSRLKPILYGLAYTPFNALEPWCGATLNNVTEDILLMSQLTTRLRMYGSACNQTQLVLQAIQDTKVNMTVWLGAYVGDNSTVNAEQQQWVLDALQIYGTDNVGGVTIGNEYILNADNKATAINYLISQMSAFRTQLAALKLPKTLPVGTADAGSSFTNANTLAAGSDFIMANVHPWFGGVNINQAAGWTWEFFEENDVAISEAVTNKPTPYVAETGWPTASMTPANATLGAAVAGVSELQTFLNTYPCQANANNSYYFFFEPFDEPWKVQFGGVEPYWGLFNSDRTLKDITFPTCEVDSGHASG